MIELYKIIMNIAITNDAEIMFCNDVIYSVYKAKSNEKHRFQVIQYDYLTLKPIGIMYGDSTHKNIKDIRMCGNSVIVLHSSLLIIKLKATTTLIDDLTAIEKNPVSVGEIIGTASDDIIISSYGSVCKTVKNNELYNIFVYSDDSKQFEFICASKTMPTAYYHSGNKYTFGETELFTFPICPYTYDNNTIYSAGNGELKIKVDRLKYISFIKYCDKWHVAVPPSELYKFTSKSAAAQNYAIALVLLE